MKLGISSCLMGQMCRYNGGHSRDSYIMDQLSNYFDFVPYCPEAVIFGTPRDAIQLAETPTGERKVLKVHNQHDVTKEVEEIASLEAKRVKEEGVCGFIFKSKSPSCGIERVKVYQEGTSFNEKKGRGLFAEAVMEQMPYLPIEEEGRLHDAWLRENFLMQVFAYANWHAFKATHPSMGELVAFHTTYKYLLYAKSQAYYKALGSIVANHEHHPLERVIEAYEEQFLRAIALKGSRNKTYNVLLHIFGYFSKQITTKEREELLLSLDDYKEGIVPLITIITVFNLMIRRFDIDYLAQQKFLSPYPSSLALRSDVEAFK
jgi:uncharacterized protein YbgA (DUF1722 family)/uncharacterized protein YbbK (DUF523 family)